jgi:hypothetical protein
MIILRLPSKFLKGAATTKGQKIPNYDLLPGKITSTHIYIYRRSQNKPIPASSDIAFGIINEIRTKISTGRFGGIYRVDL